jgi:hypothetical protein
MATPRKITDDHWEVILDRIKDSGDVHKKGCVPFLGAAVNISRREPRYDGLRLGAQVALELKKRTRFTGRDPRNLARVALEFQVNRDRAGLIEELKKILPDAECEPSPLLNTLAALPFKLIVSTNYDRLMERALELHGHRYEPIVQPIEGFPNTSETTDWFTRLEGDKEVLLLYKIHGTFQEHGLSPLIVTEDDYIEFLTVAGVENIGCPRLIAKHLTPSTLLFLGYGLEDWDFRAIYKKLINSLHRYEIPQSFAIQKDPPAYLVKYWQKQKENVEIYNVDLYDFAGELEKRYVERHGPLSFPRLPVATEET